MNNPHIGSSLDDFLAEEGLLEEAAEHAIKSSVLAWQIAREMRAQRLTEAAMAKRMATSRAQLDRLLNPKNTSVTTLHTLQRAAAVLGKRLRACLSDLNLRRCGSA